MRAEYRLAFRVNPVQVLHDQEKRLDLALPEPYTRDRVDRTLTALDGVERVPCGIVRGYVGQREQRGEHRLQGFVQGQQRAGHLPADVPDTIPVVDPEVAFQQIDDRQVARPPAVRRHGALEDPPALEPMRAEKFVQESRLANARVSDDGDH